MYCLFPLFRPTKSKYEKNITQTLTKPNNTIPRNLMRNDGFIFVLLKTFSVDVAIFMKIMFAQ